MKECRGTKNQSGMTLIETTVASGLFVLVLCICGSLVRMAYNAYSQGDNRSTDFRQASIAFSAMVNETRNCTEIYQPAQALSQQPFHLSASPLIFVCSAPDGSASIIGYQLNPDHSLQRSIYPAPYTPNATGQASDPTTTRILNQHFQDLSLQYAIDTQNNESLQFNGQTTDNDYLQTLVHIVSGYCTGSQTSNGLNSALLTGEGD
jgi:hypothetical protein